jgi:cathepsin L
MTSISTLSSYRLLMVLSIFSATILNLSAQNDRLGNNLNTVHNAQAQSDRLRARQNQLNSKPAVKSQLDNINRQISSQRLTFKVAYTPAMDRVKTQLVGLKPPYQIDADAIQQQDNMNERIAVKAAADLKKDNMNAPDVSVSSRQSANKDRNRVMPSSYYAGLNILPEIKDQGSCGSCWAFSACAVYETAFRKFYGTARPIDLSEQDLVDCAQATDGSDAGSCNGGYSDYAFDYIRTSGTTSEFNKRYTGADGECGKTTKNYWAYTWGQVYPNNDFPNVDQVKKYIYTYGAVVSYMKAGIESFYGYQSGVYNDHPSDDPNDVDHAVVLVGWDDDTQSWIVRNSWGKDWGYSGYAYVSYNSCNIGKWVYWIYPRFAKKASAVSVEASDTGVEMQGSNVEEQVEESPILKGHRRHRN